ncbi:MAG: alpha/beta fold hydrolase [Bdellovibrionota bacterium]
MSHITTEDGTRIFYRDQGEGDPVVLIHGWPLNADMWEYQTPALLQAGYRVIAYDRRGFGRSSHAAKGYDYDTLASDLNELIDQLDIKGVSLVGFSMAGGEIARYLSRFGSDAISRVALVSSIVPYMLKSESNPYGVPSEAFSEIIEQLGEDRPYYLATFAKQFFGVGMVSKPVSNEMLDWAAFMAYQAGPKATMDCVNSFGTTDFRPDLPAFHVPTLIIHGTADKIVPIAATGEAAANALPQAIYRPYDGAPHGLFVTHKDMLTADLLSFLKVSAAVDKVFRKKSA